MNPYFLLGSVILLLAALLVVSRKLDRLRSELTEMIIMRDFYRHSSGHFERECDRWANRALRRVRDRHELTPEVADALKQRDAAGLVSCHVCGWFHAPGDGHGPG